ncbi:hypothetical protein BPAE_0005g01010 [Botrytis paeoniae]|uniref:Uncharacterized protein n=1 Tax=Botrytis paeoniae TaxID=278948 RepID=A0A4Z1G125_9HELO|nr:hypothetical protein BPAE_0005g01010 [Botrytis paeoniae]
MPERVKQASELTSEEKVKLMNWFVQADPVLKFETEIVAKCIEDTYDGKYTIRGRGMKMKQIEIRNSNRPKKRKAWIPNTIDIPDYVDESDVDEGDGDGQEEIAEGGTGEGTLGGSAEGSGGINSGSDQSYEDGSLATDEDDIKNSHDGSEQEEINEEQVGDEDVNDKDTSSAVADEQNQAIDKQSLQPKKRGRRSPGESSRSSSGGVVEVERSGMSELALKERMKSPKKKQKTGAEKDAELDVEQEAGENSGL